MRNQTFIDIYNQIHIKSKQVQKQHVKIAKKLKNTEGKSLEYQFIIGYKKCDDFSVYTKRKSLEKHLKM